MPTKSQQSDTTAQKWWYYVMPFIALGLTRVTMSGADWSSTWAWVAVFIVWFFVLAAAGVAVAAVASKHRQATPSK